ncbi:MAG: 50S ribosomal protein L35 [Phycisphaerales bacterium]|nr:50S ribosomal protein L35 [Phycisphaerales bacterium]
MPKMKTHKGLKKRIRISARGKVKVKKPGSGHLMGGKSGNRCRRLRKLDILTGKIADRIKLACPEA